MAKNLPRVPYTLARAVEQFSSSEFAKLAFGSEAVEHYTHFYRTEAAAYDKAVTDWERKRYFERI
jgi:glutamine synthetase